MACLFEVPCRHVSIFQKILLTFFQVVQAGRRDGEADQPPEVLGDKLLRRPEPADSRGQRGLL